MRNFIGIIGWLCLSGTLRAQGIDRNRVMEYLQDQQYEEAITYLRPKVNPREPREMALLGYTCYQGGKMADAADIYEKVLILDSTLIPALQNLATIRSQQERYGEAVHLYQRIVQLKPASAAAWKQLGFAAFIAQMPDSGFVWLQQAYQLNPADARVAARTAEEWMERKAYPRADSITRVFLERDSTASAVLTTAAKTTYMVKNYQRTAGIGEQLQRLNVVSPNTFVYVIAANYALKKYQACIDTYQYLLDRNAASESVTYYTALAHTALRQYQESNMLLLRCIGFAKSSSLESYYSSMAANYESLRQFKPALANLDTSWYLSHKPLRQYSMGRIYETGLHNGNTAMKYYKRFLQLYKPGSSPEETEIHQYLQSRMKTQGYSK
ncbi:Tfp pilus assembly protein PilF [Chitinophaga eiseniae]|uniref:Tfp pilus assembly protein PilF n=1 Tax=Chitinophaga eiseniae TaxID=634771 RepID=A0A1T4U558_9BACT|nr:tetratricopeptide repeat protein [Chitinophaga eiseniae]SKA47823.1 Tfp pilus assembly protein PilF [Chitinophaga eiseniae]